MSLLIPLHGPATLLGQASLLRHANSTVVEILIFCGALVLVTIAAMFWAVFFRPKHRHAHHHHHHHHRDRDREQSGQPPVDRESDSHHHRRRRKRREHRPMNPTLAQTGGLPPVRSEQKPAPPA